MEKVIAVGVLGELGGHRADDGHVVDVFGDVGKEIAHGSPAFPMLLELPGAGKGPADIIELGRFDFHGKGLAVVRDQPWLGVERVDLGRPPVHVEVNHVLDLGGEVGRPGSKWRRRGRILSQGGIPGQHRGECNGAKAATTVREHLPTR